MLLLPLSILISLFGSCNNNNKSNSTDQDVIAFAESAETTIDTTSWLKPSKGIRGIFEDSKGNLWFSSTDYVCMFEGSKFTYFTEEDGLCGTGRIQEDQNGIIWIQAGAKLCSYDGRQFSSHTLKPSESMIEWESSANDIWFHKEAEQFGETEGPPEVYRYNGDEFTFLALPVPESEYANQMGIGPAGTIKGKDGTLWFASMEVAFGFNGESFTFIGREEMGRKDDSRNMGIRALFEDSKGNLWIGDNGSGVFLYNGDSTINFTKLHRLDKEDTNGNSLHRVFSIAEDDAGNIWFGTYLSGIWRYDGESLTDFAEKDGLKSDLIWTIYKTKQGDLLFGGEYPGAVYKFNGISFDRVY